MKRIVLCCAALAALSVLWLGCDDDSYDEPHWMAPADINGVWIQDTNFSASVGYCLTVTVTQTNTAAAVLYTYGCSDQTNTVEVAYPATYDTTNGVLTVQYDLECWRDYFRFTSVTNMYRVSDPVTNIVHGVPFEKQL
jgi:hypothetical protein